MMDVPMTGSTMSQNLAGLAVSQKMLISVARFRVRYILILGIQRFSDDPDGPVDLFFRDVNGRHQA